MAKNILLILMMFAVASPALAHDPKTFNSFFYKKGQNWVFKVTATHEPLHQAAEKAGVVKKEMKRGSKEYTDAIISYVLQRFEMYQGDIKLQFSQSVIKSEGHHTHLFFIVKNFDDKMKDIKVKVDVAKENPGHINEFQLIDLKTDKFKKGLQLSAKNNWTLSLSL